MVSPWLSLISVSDGGVVGQGSHRRQVTIVGTRSIASEGWSGQSVKATGASPAPPWTRSIASLQPYQYRSLDAYWAVGQGCLSTISSVCVITYGKKRCEGGLLYDVRNARIISAKCA